MKNRFFKLQRVLVNFIESITYLKNKFFLKWSGMKGKLSAGFQPVHLEIINESYMHSVPKDAETHFKVDFLSNNDKLFI